MSGMPGPPLRPPGPGMSDGAGPAQQPGMTLPGPPAAPGAATSLPGPPPATGAQAPGGTQSGGNHGWQEHKAKDGRVYYFNAITKTSSWEKPAELMTDLERADMTTPWREFKSADGRPYWYNKTTKESRWVMPEEVKEARKAVTEKKLAPPAYPGPPGLQPGPNLVSAAPPTVPAASQPPPASVPSAPSLPPPASMPGAGAPLAPPPPLCMGPGGMPPMMPPPPFGMPPGMMAPLPPPPMGYPGMPPMPGPMPGMPPMGMEPKEEEPVKYATREEARQAFKQMLTDCNVDPKATWESAMRSIVTDRRYVALTTVKEKKTAFGEWRVQRERELKEEKKAARQRALDAFKEMLEERRFDLRGCRTLGEVAGKLGGEERWKRVETDRDRGEVFAQWAQEREKKDAEERREAFRARVAGFKALLEKRELGMEDTWAQVERRIEFEPEFKELSKTERLDAFIEVMEDLAARENERLSEARRAARREARKARDAFRALLESLAAAGRIHARMRWGEALTIVEEESYEQCCRAKEGSRPKELFEDMVLGMEEALDKQRMVVKRVMRAFGVSVEAGSTFEGYRAQLQGAAEEDAAQRKRRAEGGGEEGVVWVGERSVEEELDRVPTLNLRIIFDEQKDRARQDQAKAEKRRRRARDDFMSMLRHKGRLTVASTFEEVKGSLSGRREWEGIETEEEQRELFERVMKRVREKEEERGRSQGRSKERSRERNEGKEKRRGRSREKSRERSREKEEKEEGRERRRERSRERSREDERPSKRARREGREGSDDSKEDGEL